ncbi:uncharacterized protein LOC135224414 isoform X2 [Macrobrachium nipponense]|uniref:uncharacterized protein LOC135224414 isoform X2 n=2 Tax=Macrobrachium nipponense TaxID=159736 RepID=UPI0030C7FCEA
MMSLPSSASCGVCCQLFNNELNRPHNLPCSHHFCAKCIDDLIAQDAMACPNCQKSFKVKSAGDLMVNHALIDCINSFLAVKRKPSKLGSKKNARYQERIDGLKEEVCKSNEEVMADLKHMKEDVERLMKGEEQFQTSLSTLRRYLSEDVLAHFQKLISKIDEHHQKSSNARLKLKDSLKDILKNEGKLVSARKVLDSASTLEDTSAVIDETEDINMDVRDWTDNLKEYVANEDNQLQERNKELKVSEKFHSKLMKLLISEPEEDAFHLIPITGVAASKMDLSSQVTAIGLWEMSIPVKILVEEGRVFALQEKDNTRKSAKITIENGELLLYSLQDEEEPVPNAYYVQYEDVLGLAISKSTVFLDLETKGLSVGRVSILLNDNGRHYDIHKHFTGGSGESYSGTPLQIANRGQLWERALFGYQISEVVSGDVADFSLEHNHVTPGNRGIVWNLNHSRTPPLFGIHMGPCALSYGGHMGNVEEGMDILSDALHWSKDIKEVKVSQCGLVLPTKGAVAS